MGQQTNGIMYGVRVPASATPMYDEDYKSPIEKRGLINRWEATHRKGRKQREAVPTFDENYDVVGFWVAVGASGKDGLPDLDTPVALNDIETTKPYAASCQKARKKWNAFAKWAATQGVVFPIAQAWLTVTEVA